MREYERLAAGAAVCLNRVRLPLLREQLRDASMLQLACQKVSIESQVAAGKQFAKNQNCRQPARNGEPKRGCQYDRKKGHLPTGSLPKNFKMQLHSL